VGFMGLAVDNSRQSYIDIEEEKREEIDEEINNNLYKLTPRSQQVFWAYVDNINNGNRLNDGALAQKVGITYQYLSMLKAKPCWVRAFQLIVINSAMSRTLANTDKYISNLERLAEEDVSANKVLLNVSGVLKQAGGFSINVNTQTKTTSSKNAIELLDEFIISMGKAGVQPEYILNRYIELKNQNAF
jgi:hypothetical protein